MIEWREVSVLGRSCKDYEGYSGNYYIFLIRPRDQDYELISNLYLPLEPLYDDPCPQIRSLDDLKEKAERIFADWLCDIKYAFRNSPTARKVIRDQIEGISDNGTPLEHSWDTYAVKRTVSLEAIVVKTMEAWIADGKSLKDVTVGDLVGLYLVVEKYKIPVAGELREYMDVAKPALAIIQKEREFTTERWEI